MSQKLFILLLIVPCLWPGIFSNRQNEIAYALEKQQIARESAPKSAIAINEIAWMGSFSSHNKEWIELYNDSALAINVDGWTIKAADNSPIIFLRGEINAQGFYLLERTGDDSVPEIAADKIYSGALENQGELLGLYNEANILVDNIDCSFGWFAGDNSNKRTMERKSSQLSGNNPDKWKTSNDTGGTPGKMNSSAYEPETAILPVKSFPLSSKSGTNKLSAQTPAMAIILGIICAAMIVSLKKNLKKMYNGNKDGEQ